MTKEIINSDGSRNWQANILLDNIKRLEQERDEWKKKYEDAANENLKEIYELIKKNDCWRGVVNVVCSKLEQENKELKEEVTSQQAINLKQQEIALNYWGALEEINILAKNYCNACDEFKAKTYKNKNDCLYCNYGFIKRKINEVLNEG